MGHPAPTPTNEAITRAVVDLLHRRAVPNRERNAKLASMLSLSLNQVRCKLMGEAKWSLADLYTLSQRFKEPLHQLMVDPLEGPAIAAVLPASKNTTRCWIWPEHEPSRSPVGPLVAVAQPKPDPWLVISLEAAAGQEVFDLRHVHIESTVRKRVAVVGDANEVVDATKDENVRFTFCETHAALLSKLETAMFDGVLLGSDIESEHLEKVLPVIRQRRGATTIIVLTGSDKAQHARQSPLRIDAANYDVIVLPKNSPPAVLSAALSADW